MAVAALLVSFGLLGESDVAVLAPAALGAVLWLMSPSRNIPSAVRKLAQVIPPVLVHYRLIDVSQSSALIAVLLSVVTMWTLKEKS